MRWTRLGRLTLLFPFGRDGRASASEGKGVGLGEREGEGPVPARRLEHFEVVFFGPKTVSLFLSPSARGEATKRPRVGICGARFHEK